ncbi:hypothetical protein [Halobacillus amylolyticus]|uniref:Uncharacterized protein n=1 Tax=Halobacillus amylolyticus TaxID=2932259 RepID=A0ABY4H875_9BACI|nr:hypothetical protein [Halobacillus amylolyticus]UOR10648.1 hypothetical protein MUO15_13385 [Halobacillus amylolyticus]
MIKILDQVYYISDEHEDNLKALIEIQFKGDIGDNREYLSGMYIIACPELFGKLYEIMKKDISEGGHFLSWFHQWDKTEETRNEIPFSSSYKELIYFAAALFSGSSSENMNFGRLISNADEKQTPIIIDALRIRKGLIQELSEVQKKVKAYLERRHDYIKQSRDTSGESALLKHLRENHNR